MTKYQFPKVNNHIQFEYFTRDLLRLIYEDSSFELYGRHGQSQYGLDGSNSSGCIFFQCKHKSSSNITDSTVENELSSEFQKAEDKIIELSKSQNSKYLFFTTHHNTTNLQDKARNLSKDNITVEYWGWTTIEDYLNQLFNSKNIDFFRQYYPEFIKPLLHKQVPTQLTHESGIDSIIGREEELHDVNIHLNNEKIVLIKGIGGIGKSTLSSYYLQTKKDKYDYYGFFNGLESFLTELTASFELTIESKNYLSISRKVFKELRTLKGSKLFIIDNLADVEEDKELIKDIISLKKYGYHILCTSRDEIENITIYSLEELNLIDAKNLFNSIFPVENENLLEATLKDLGYHPFFIDKTAHFLKNKFDKYSLQDIKNKFENGEFTKITLKRKKSFQYYLNELFTLEDLDEEEQLLLRQLSILPSIGISLEDLELFFNKVKDDDFNDLLNYLSEKSWLIKLNGGYKLHQINKEYLLSLHPPALDELDDILVYFNIWLFINQDNTKIFTDTKQHLLYFESFFKNFKIINQWNQDIILILIRIGTIYMNIGKSNLSIKYFKKALQIEEDYQICSHQLSGIYNNLSEAYRRLDQFEEALIFMEKSLKEKKKEKANISKDTIEAINYANLATTHLSKGNYTEALKFYNKALNISSEENLYKALVYKGLAEIYKLQGDISKSIDFFSKTLEIRKKFLDPNNHYIAQSYNDLGFAYSGAEEYDKALSLSKKALSLYKISLGESHHDTAISYQNVAEIYRKMEKYDKFLPLLKTAQKIIIKALGTNHSQTALIYNSFATYYADTNNDKQAIAYWKKALKIFTSTLGENHHHTIFTYLNVIDFYYQRDNYELAFKYIEPIVRMTSLSDNSKHINIPSYHVELINNTIQKIREKRNIQSKKIKRNESCPCKSGKKYKRCCGK